MIRGRVLATLGVIAALVGAALAVFAVVLADAQRSSRHNIEGRFQDRATAGARLIGSIFIASAQSGRVTLAQRYGGAVVSADALDVQARQGQDDYLVVTRADGRVIGRSHGTPPEALAAIAKRPPYFRAALRGPGIGASTSTNTAVPGTITIAQSFPTPQGARVLVSGIDPSLLSGIFGASLNGLPAVRSSRTFMLDTDGRVIVSPRRVPFGHKATAPGLLAALRHGDSGDLPNGRYYASRMIGVLPWRVVLTAPRKELFASVQGVKTWGPWALFGAFALASLLAMALVARAFRDASRIGVMNAALEDSNAALGERAAELAMSNRRLEETNDELARSNAELDRFASIASHDLREPLRKVQMFSERVIHHDSAALSERGRDYLQRMDAAARRMQALIDGLLEYSRVTSRPRGTEEVDLEQVARDVADDLEISRRDVDGRIEIGALPRVQADPLLMRQLLQNLIANALRFHRPGVPPVVTVSGRMDGDVAVLAVKDNGIGFDPRYAQRVFELFERLHPRDEYPGTGMGLALCRRIVEHHGGTIAADSAPGEGSTFTVRLPAQPRAAGRRAGDDAQERGLVAS